MTHACACLELLDAELQGAVCSLKEWNPWIKSLDSVFVSCFLMPHHLPSPTANAAQSEQAAYLGQQLPLQALELPWGPRLALVPQSRSRCL